MSRIFVKGGFPTAKAICSTQNHLSMMQAQCQTLALTLVMITTEDNIECESRSDMKYGSTVGVVFPSRLVSAEMRYTLQDK